MDRLIPMPIRRVVDRGALSRRRSGPTAHQDEREKENTPEPDQHSAPSLGQEPMTRHQNLKGRRTPGARSPLLFYRTLAYSFIVQPVGSGLSSHRILPCRRSGMAATYSSFAAPLI